jgi:polysaccharide export outer membrane protein
LNFQCKGDDVVRFRLTVVMLALLPLVACSAKPTAVRPGNDPAKAGPVVDVYRIGVDDRLQISVWRNPELSLTVPVRPDGKISVPLIGDVQAGGLLPEEVGTEIEKKLTYYIRDPKVAVIVAELRSHEFLTRIRVTGAVRTPRSMPFRQGMTVLDAVLESGGVNEFASPNRTKIHRKVDGKTRIIPVKMEDILTDGKLTTNIDLSPGDVVTVPERLF